MTNRPLIQEDKKALEKMQFEMMTSPKVSKEIVKRVSQRIQSSKPLESEFAIVIEDEFWDLVK